MKLKSKGREWKRSNTDDNNDTNSFDNHIYWRGYNLIRDITSLTSLKGFLSHKAQERNFLRQFRGGDRHADIQVKNAGLDQDQNPCTAQWANILTRGVAATALPTRVSASKWLPQPGLWHSGPWQQTPQYPNIYSPVSSSLTWWWWVDLFFPSSALITTSSDQLVETVGF